MPATQYLRKRLGDHAIGRGTFISPSSIWMGLFTASPGDIGSQANEVSGGSYARVQLVSQSPDVNLMGSFDLTSGTAFNTGIIQFPTPTADWGLVTYFGIMDAALGSSPDSNMLFYGAFSSPRSVLNGSRPVKLVTGQFQIKMT